MWILWDLKVVGSYNEDDKLSMNHTHNSAHVGLMMSMCSSVTN